MIEEMSLRRFSHETQPNDLRDVGCLATFLGRRLETATAEDLRRFQVEQREASVPVPTLNGIVLALRFIFTHALDRPDLARRLARLAYPRTLPVALSRDEVVRLLAATTRPEHRAALAVAYGAGLRVAEVAEGHGHGRMSSRAHSLRILCCCDCFGRADEEEAVL